MNPLSLFFQQAEKNLELCLRTIGKPKKDQRNMVRGALNSLLILNEGEISFPSLAQIIEAPNGAGKSAAIVAIAMTYAQNDKRVLILEPNKLLIEEIMQYFNNAELFNKKDYSILNPYTEFQNICQLETTKGRNASGTLCKRWGERCLETSCEMKNQLEVVTQTKIVLATQHKMIYDRLLLEGKIVDSFDLTIIDEFHMIPEVVEAFKERHIPMDVLKKQLESLPEITAKENLSSLITEYYQFSDDKHEQRDIVKEFYQTVKDNKLEDEIFGFSSRGATLKQSYRGFTAERKIRELNLLDTQFLLFSATIIDAKDVIYNQLNIDGVKISHKLEYYGDSWERLQRISIFGTTDLPRLRKANPEEYRKNLDTTVSYLNNLLSELDKTNALKRFNTLVLCNSLDDANIVKSYFEKSIIGDRLLNLDEIQRDIEKEFGLEDIPAIASRVGRRVSKLVATKTRIILVTGSSVFWQGVNIDNVRLLFVLTLPYRKPTEKELKSKRRGWMGHYSATSQFKYMVRKLSQGIGRLCRTENIKDLGYEEIKNWGLAIILDGRLDTIRTSVINKFPKVYRTQFNFFSRDRLSEGIIKMIKHSLKHRSPYDTKGQLRLSEWFN